MKKALPLVSIVVATKNEEKNIGQCLESIKKQTYVQEKIETIVIDNFSTDKTREIARGYTSKVFKKGPERSVQRNFGILKKAKGKYVMYLDADMILAPTLIKKAVEKLESSQLIALYIPEIVLGNSFFSQVRRFERSFYDGTVIDGLRFFKREAFVKVGGFDENLWAFEDWDLDKRIKKLGKVDVLEGYDFERVNKVSRLTKKAFIFHNEAEFRLRNYLAKKTYYAKSADAYFKKWGKNDPDLKKQFGFVYRYFGVFVENDKWKKLVGHPILTLGMYFLRFGVGGLYLFYKFFKK